MLGESVKKGKFGTKPFIYIYIYIYNFESSSEKFKNMISADVKADVKQQVIKELVPISSNFLYIQNLNDNVKLVCIFGFT